MDFLIETVAPSAANMIVTEATATDKNMWISGICMQANIKNRNGRIYPVYEIESAVKSAMERIKENNGIFGELDHPQTLTINSDRVSHAITELWMDGNNAYGKAKMLNTPMGLIGQELIKSGVRVGVSSRGAGNVTESGDVNGFVFTTYDLVLTPSAPDALVQPVYEHLEHLKSGNRVLTLAEQVRHDKDAQKYFEREIKSFVLDVLYKK